MSSPYDLFPIGLTQTLSIGSFSLTLSAQNYDFLESDDLRFGYWREDDPTQEQSVLYSLLGAAVLNGTSYEQKQKFRWKLLLERSKLLTLQLIAKEQENRIQNSQANPGITLVDQRIAMIEPAPQTRQRQGAVITDPAPISGSVQYWPVFSVKLNTSGQWWSFKGMADKDNGDGIQPLYTVDLAGVELDLLPP